MRSWRSCASDRATGKMLVAKCMLVFMCAIFEQRWVEINSSAQNVSEMSAGLVVDRTFKRSDSDIPSDISSVKSPLRIPYDASL